jgi:hypothetical protein
MTAAGGNGVRQKRSLSFFINRRQIPPMRGILPAVGILALLPVAHAETALDAMKQLPREQAARVARIEGRDGSPEPDRWYILTQDPATDTGVHEFVVSKGEIVASRPISQFADSLKPADIVGMAPLKIDSDKAAALARSYADANGVVVAGINYELKLDGTDAAPAWTISCVDDKGNKVGEIVITADKGTVVSHDGFALEPAASPTPEPVSAKTETPHFDTYAKSEVAPMATPPGSPPDHAGTHHHKPLPKKPENAVAKTFQDVGRTLQKFNPF